MTWVSECGQRLICWNIEHKRASWRMLREMEADVALLQEARPPPADVDISLHDINDPGEWPEGRAGRVAIVRLCDRFTVEFIEKSFTEPQPPRGGASRPAARRGVHRRSICPEYEYPHALVPGKMKNVDSSLHRSISDLSAFIGRPKHHRVIVAGDFTVMRGPSEYRDAYWSAREQTIFDRMTPSRQPSHEASPQISQGKTRDLPAIPAAYTPGRSG